MEKDLKSVGRESDKFMLRLPDGMRDRIAEAAKEHGRSMNAEIVARLQDSFDGPSPSTEFHFKLGYLSGLISAARDALRTVRIKLVRDKATTETIGSIETLERVLALPFKSDPEPENPHQIYDILPPHLKKEWEDFYQLSGKADSKDDKS